MASNSKNSFAPFNESESVPCDKVEYTWFFERDQIKELCDKKSKKICSPSFQSNHKTPWYFKFKYDTEGFVAAYLFSEIVRIKTATFTLTLHANAGPSHVSTPGNFSSVTKYGGWGWRQFISKDEILKEKYDFNGKLKFSCTLEVVKNQVIEDSTIVRRQSSLGNDFSTLLETGDFADIQFKVGDRYFKAHRSILMIRSDYFKALLSENFVEGKHRAFEVEDVDVKTFEAILTYIYTGHVNFIRSSAKRVIVAADRYNLEELVVMCEEYLCKCLVISNVVEVLMLANDHARNKLKNAVIDITLKNFSEIQARDDWKKLKEENPNLAMEVLGQNVQSLKKKPRCGDIV